MKITKSSGLTEEFDIRKLSNSLMRSGAPPEVADEIAAKVQEKISPLFRTKDIYRLARKLLKHYNLASGMKYSLKKALFALGPSGYPFEKYVARILDAHGYSAMVGQFIEGYCVKHEVDVVASKGNEHYFIECKYHSNGGKATDVKVAMYIHSRFLDIKKACELMPEHADTVHNGWLVTNTRCTSDAVKYAECVGLKMLSWGYPEKESLQKMIELKRLYPVTILPAARKKYLETLIKNDIILAQDIADLDEMTFLKKSGLDPNTSKILKKQADELCPCTA
ncbi:MAG: restriction endonuclease [Nitrospirota bacterium]